MQKTIGVLLGNLGTPDYYDYASMRRYLKEFLSDRRIIEMNRLLWYPILYGIILNTRPQKSGKNYQRIWDKNGVQGSPLLYYTNSQVTKLTELFTNKYPYNLNFYCAMRYGNPSMASVLTKIIADGCDKIIFIPLFPQYSATTVASLYDSFFTNILKFRDIPAIETIKTFCDHAAYIRAIAQSIKNHLAKLNFVPEKILVSFHGIPKSYCDLGDPYYHECQKTLEALTTELPALKNKLKLCFQSRFGSQEWLQPYTSAVVQDLPKKGIKNIAIINPGFISDCLETIDEIDREIRLEFIEAGGENFTHIPCLNDSDEAITMLEQIISEQLVNN